MAREKLQLYARVVEDFEALCRNITEEQLSLSLSPGKWTVWEQMVHIVDCEIVGMFRVRKVLAEHKPFLSVFDQNAWVDKLDYSGLSPADVGTLLTALHRYNEVLLNNLYPKQREKVGVHEERGIVSAGDIVSHHINHIAHHVDCIKTICTKAAIKEIK